MPTHPTGYVSLCEVAKRAAVALHEPAGGALGVVSRALLIIGGGEGWAAVLKDLQADNDHVPHTLRAFAWCRGHSPLLEIRSAFWRGGFEGARMRIDHTSPAPQGAPVSILPRHVRLRGDWAVPPVLKSEAADFARLDGEWALPLVLESDADAFMRRITGAPAPAAQPALPPCVEEKTVSPDDTGLEGAAFGDTPSRAFSQMNLGFWLAADIRTRVGRKPNLKAHRAEAAKHFGRRIPRALFEKVRSEVATRCNYSAYIKPGRPKN